MDWRVVQYNPLSLLPSDRLSTILDELGLQHFVGIVGTGHRVQSQDPSCTTYKCGKYLVYDFPVRPGAICPQKCTGLVLAISTKTFSWSNVIRVVEIPVEFSGRVAALRVRDVDFFFVAVYVPTEPRTVAERAHVQKLWAYLDRLLDAVPARCVPILCLDATPVVGRYDVQTENHNGTQLRMLCERHHLSIVNTFFPAGPTYRGEFSESRIDYFLLPSSLLPSVRDCAVFHGSGQRLQKIATPGWRDHRPLHCAFRHKLAYVEQSRGRGHRWNHAALVAGVSAGYARDRLVAAVTAALEAPELTACSQGPPGPYWALLNDTVKQAAQQFYTQPPGRQSSQPSDLVAASQARQDALQRIVRMSPQRLRCDGILLQDMQRIVRAWCAVAQYWRARKHHEDLLKRVRRTRRSHLLWEFRTAWSQRQLATMWKASRSLAHTSLGPKRRRYDVPLAEHPDAAQWSFFLQGSGPAGGCNASVLPGVDYFL